MALLQGVLDTRQHCGRVSWVSRWGLGGCSLHCKTSPQWGARSLDMWPVGYFGGQGLLLVLLSYLHCLCLSSCCKIGTKDGQAPQSLQYNVVHIRQAHTLFGLQGTCPVSHPLRGCETKNTYMEPSPDGAWHVCMYSCLYVCFLVPVRLCHLEFSVCGPLSF